MSSPIASTISTLFPQSKLSSNSTPVPSFDSSNLILIPSGASDPPDRIKGQIKALVEAADKVATSLAFSSILAGQGSESDDNGDVGIWLGEGDYEEGREVEVLAALGLQGWAPKERYCFRVKKGGPRSGGSVAFFLLGNLDDQGWGGLVGIGIWADE